MSDTIKTLARALRLMHQDAMDGVALRDIHTRDIATALHAQIAPMLRAEGMEMAIRWHQKVAANCEFDGCKRDADQHTRYAIALGAQAKRLREGGEG